MTDELWDQQRAVSRPHKFDWSVFQRSHVTNRGNIQGFVASPPPTHTQSSSGARNGEVQGNIFSRKRRAIFKRNFSLPPAPNLFFTPVTTDEGWSSRSKKGRIARMEQRRKAEKRKNGNSFQLLSKSHPPGLGTVAAVIQIDHRQGKNSRRNALPSNGCFSTHAHNSVELEVHIGCLEACGNAPFIIRRFGCWLCSPYLFWHECWRLG